jgi:hypothetical protein
VTGIEEMKKANAEAQRAGRRKDFTTEGTEKHGGESKERWLPGYSG